MMVLIAKASHRVMQNRRDEESWREFESREDERAGGRDGDVGGTRERRMIEDT